MPSDQNSSYPQEIGISLVAGDPAVRHARQLMLRSEKYEVRSYSTSAALLADPNSRDYACIILEVGTEHGDVGRLLREMRASGWQGKALLLNGLHPDSALLREAEQHGDKVLPRDVGDRALLSAIAASVDRSWAGWNAVG